MTYETAPGLSPLRLGIGDKVRLVFIDDSQQSEPPRPGLGHLLALGAVIVRDEQIAPYATTLAAIRTELGIPPGEEIKWKPPRDSFLAKAGRELSTELRTRMLQAAIDHEIRSIVVILDHGAAYKSLTQAAVGKELLKWLFERVAMHLNDHNDIGVMIADKPGGGSVEETRWLASTLTLTNDGTEYVKPGRIVLPVMTAPSHHVPHLQLADLVVAASTAAVARRKSGLDLMQLLRQLAHRHPIHGHVNGIGIVLYPQELINLYYWAFGEEFAFKASRNTGPALPKRGFPYDTDDGLGGPAT